MYWFEMTHGTIADKLILISRIMNRALLCRHMQIICPPIGYGDSILVVTDNHDFICQLEAEYLKAFPQLVTYRGDLP